MKLLLDSCVSKSDWAFSALPESEIGPCFKENLAAALALINCAGHDAPATTRACTFSTSSPAGVPAAKCQFVRDAWNVFRLWSP